VRHYSSYSAFLKQRFGVPVLKIPVNGGFSCPNRDGTLGVKGCAFCDNRAFSPASLSAESPAVQLVSSISAASGRFKVFIAYLQPFTNTYGTVDALAAVYEPLVQVPGVVGLSIGTRPDCLPDTVITYLGDLARRTYLCVELGLQTSHDDTLTAINRGHGFNVFVSAAERLSAAGVEIVAHIVLGLPGETPRMMYETAARLAALPVSGVKFHQLMIIKGTAMEQLHAEGKVAALTLEDYTPVLCGCIERLRPDQHVHRLMADTKRERGLVAPLWSADKQSSLKYLHDHMDRHKVEQGRIFGKGSGRFQQ
jgi:radical SAM protein (TIGR01212 family)